MDPLRVKSFLLLLLLGLLSILHAEQPLKSSILFHPVSLYAEPIHGSPLVITLEEGKKISFQKVNAAMIDAAAQEKIKKYNVKSVPTIVFIDKEGKMIAQEVGAMSEETLVLHLEELLKK